MKKAWAPNPLATLTCLTRLLMSYTHRFQVFPPRYARHTGWTVYDCLLKDSLPEPSGGVLSKGNIAVSQIKMEHQVSPH